MNQRTKFKLALTLSWQTFLIVMTRAILLGQGWDLPSGWVPFALGLMAAYGTVNVGATWAHGRNEDEGGAA